MTSTPRFRLTIAYLILAAAVIIALALSLANQTRIEREAKAAADRVAEVSRQDAIALCESANEVRSVILTLTERISDSNRGGTDFTAVPGYEDLDPETQAYLQALSTPPAATEQPGDDRLVAIAREVLVPKDCSNP